MRFFFSFIRNFENLKTGEKLSLRYLSVGITTLTTALAKTCRKTSVGKTIIEI